MTMVIVTTQDEKVMWLSEEAFPFVVSLSNHERDVRPSTGSGRTDHGALWSNTGIRRSLRDCARGQL